MKKLKMKILALAMFGGSALAANPASAADLQPGYTYANACAGDNSVCLFVNVSSYNGQLYAQDIQAGTLVEGSPSLVIGGCEIRSIAYASAPDHSIVSTIQARCAYSGPKGSGRADVQIVAGSQSGRVTAVDAVTRQPVLSQEFTNTANYESWYGAYVSRN